MSIVALDNQLKVTWADTFSAERGYRVERQLAAGPWETQESLPASPGTGSEYRWSRVIDGSAVYRVLALRDGYTVALQRASGESEVPVEPPGSALQLQVDQPEPLDHDVQLTVEGAPDARMVRYFVDTNAIGSTAVAPAFSQLWDSTAVADGDHALQAHVEMAEGAIVELRRVVITDNPNVAVSLTIKEQGASIRLRAQASSDAGIQTVEFFQNGVSLAVLSAPNEGPDYVHYLVKASLASGPVTFKAVATDSALENDEDEVEFVIDHPPFVTLSKPVDGDIVSGGNLLVEGVFGDDQPGTTLTISLGDVQIAQRATSPFTASYPLAGFPGGAYTLTTLLIDSAGRHYSQQRQIIVSSTQFTYELVASGVTAALASDDGALLYQRSDGTFAVRSSGGVETTLQVPAGVAAIRDWQMDVGRVAMFGSTPPPLTSQYHVFVFDAVGAARLISREVAPPAGTNLHPVLQWPWVAWNTGTSGEYRIYNFDTDTLHRIARPAGAAYIGNWLYDFAGASGAEQFAFWAQTGGSGVTSQFNVFSYDLASQVTVPITAGTSKQVYVQGDDSRVAWRKSPDDQLDPPFELMVGPASIPASAAAASSAMTAFYLDDGLLSWTERTGGVTRLKVDDGSSTTIVATAASITLYSVADGRVLFGEGGKLHAWSAALGRRVILDALPRSVVQSDGIAFMATGTAEGAIHRIALP